MKEEEKEKQYLSDFLISIDKHIVQIEKAIQLKKEEIDYMNNHMQEHKRDMDHLEKNAMRESVFNYTLQGEHSVRNRLRLERLKDIAYFGRIDFTEKGSKTKEQIYIGVHHFQDKASSKKLAYDWRAPIASLFYDFEPGKAHYETSKKAVFGDISLKRQFRIRKGKMEYMLDTDINIHDEILQKELNQASSAKMKNIVASIQKEQNAIIRNEDARHLIIQGVAGSGKTSIALHRIAFLLYRFKENLSSEDILIISPNKVFASYISNVLPELGEETVEEKSMEDIANEFFDYQLKFQNFFEQTTEVLEKNNSQYIERIRFKSSDDILKKVDEYLNYLENDAFTISNIFVKGKPVPGWFIRESFQKYSRMPLLKRFNEVVQEIVDNVYRYYQIEIQYKDRNDLHQQIRNMFISYNPKVLYKNFYNWLEKPEMYKQKKGSSFEWSDVYVYMYLIIKLEGINPNTKVKHLVVDEMQDYSAVQYKVLSLIFPCKKTILGDVNQSVNPYSSSDLPSIQKLFPDATAVKMLKSYRSTYEITLFTQKICQNNDIVAIPRHGEIPKIYAVKTAVEELKEIKALLSSFLKKKQYNSFGIICKTQKQAEDLHTAVENDFRSILLTASSNHFTNGIIISTAQLAKGLEFDQVLVPFCNKKNYHTQTDKQMLYVACTRAMHKLFISYTNTLTPFISL